MPSLWHDAANQLFRDHPWLAPKIVRERAYADLPAHLTATVGSPQFNDRKSRDFYADTVVVVGGPPNDPAYGVIVEPQQSQDSGKLHDWPRYAAAFWLETGKPAWVLVFCPNHKVADWYLRRQPVATNLPDYSLPLIVIGPAQIPVITDPADVVSDAAMGVLSFVAHGDGDPAVVQAFESALVKLPPASLRRYYELAHSMSVPTLRNVLEEFMASDVLLSSPIAKENFALGLAEGEAKGEARAVLFVLEARGLVPSEQERATITGCTDLAQLQAWITKAVTVSSVGELFV
jgi:hypothetical protein